MISLPTRLTDDTLDRHGTATLIDNIWTNNVSAGVRSGLVTVRIPDHLPIFALVGGEREVSGLEQGGSEKRLLNGSRMARFAEDLQGWDFDEERALGAEGNVAKFRNGFRDLYDAAFPLAEDKRRREDVEKPWLDEVEFKELVREKGDL